LTRILHVTRSAWGGGLERAALALAEAALDRGWDVSIAYWHGEPPAAARVPYERVAGGRVPRWPVDVARIVKLLRPDIVHLHGSAAGSAGALAARIAGRMPIVYTEGGLIERAPLKDRLALRSTKRIPDAVIAVSDAVAQSLFHQSRFPRERIRVVHTGVADAPPLDAPADDRRRFIAIGNLWPWKDHATLVRAAARLDADVEVVVCGEGPCRADLERQAAAAGVEDKVRFVGFRNDPWTSACALVHTSRSDGFPLAIAEAMMRGLPVVATDAGGTREIVEDGSNGLLVDPGDDDAVAREMTKLANHRALRDELARNARAFAQAHLRLEPWIRTHFALYEELLRDR
jgi:glycosyltransferase involved in cell wall biosynthesis